ncbi:MAG: ABC transporter ATP-binding protein [Acidobacteriota bacterium]
MESPLVVEELRKKFGEVAALDGVSVTLRAGEILGLLGPNGAGKTTLVRAIVGRVRPDSGNISIDGSPLLPGHSALRSTLGWVPQELAIYPLLSVEDNLRTFGRYQNLEGEELGRAVDRALGWSGLADRRGHRTETLSGGMKRRLNMAVGVIHGPKIALMDEPTVGVDPQSREKIYEMIRSMNEAGTALIYTTHYMEEAERLCDRIAVLDHGRIIAEGTCDELVLATVGPGRMVAIELDEDIPPVLQELWRSRGAVVDQRSLRLKITSPRTDLQPLFRELDEQKLTVRDFALTGPTLESVFLFLTGRELRE